MEYRAWLLAGATATGKTAAAQVLAERTGRAILSADSMLVYHGMDIGTAKPALAERGPVSYFGMDIVTPAEAFSTGRWLAAAAEAFGNGRGRGASLIVVGGTGLYLKALTDGLEGEAVKPERREYWSAFLKEKGADGLRKTLQERWPGALERIVDPENPRRLERAAEQLEATGKLPHTWTKGAARPPLAVLRMARDVLAARIARRVEAMFKGGLLDEVRGLRAKCPAWSATAAKAIGYEEALAVLDGTMTEAAAKERVAIRTRQLAKRQETWFRHQANAVWVDVADGDTAEAVADRVERVWDANGPTAIAL